MEHEEIITVKISDTNQADIVRAILDSDLCKHFIDKEPFYLLLFMEVMDAVFDEIGKLSRMQQVANIIGDDHD